MGKILIHKQIIPMEDEFTLLLPKTAQIVSVGVQREVPCMWYAFEDRFEKELAPFKFLLVTTGHPVEVGRDAELKFLGRIMLANDQFVAHVFQPFYPPPHVTAGLRSIDGNCFRVR